MSHSYGWLLDETTKAGRENLDLDHASRYDSKENAAAEEEVSRLKQLGLNRQSQVVDLGAGTGQFALAAAAESSRVVAVDPSPVMLSVLRAKMRADDVSNIEVIEAGFLTYEHQGPPADFVYSRYALHHLPDFWKAMALDRLRRTLRAGGVLRLWDVVYRFEPSEAQGRLDQWCETIGADVKEGWTRADLIEHIRDEHSTFTWLLEPMIERAGFEIEEAVYSPNEIFAQYIARAV